MQDNAFEYWNTIEARLREDAELDKQALDLAKAIKKAMPQVFIQKIRDNCYLGNYGWSQLIIDARGCKVREWGGFHEPDKVDDIVKAAIEQNEYWVKAYHGQVLSYEQSAKDAPQGYKEVTLDD